MSKTWSRNASMISRLGEKLSNYKLPLRDKIIHTIFSLKLQKKKLDSFSLKIERHDKELLNRCVKSQVKNDKPRAVMYANECAEVRKMAKIVIASRLALEQIILRLETVKQFGEIAHAMTSIPQVIQTIRTQIAGIMPEASFELNEICESLETITIQCGEALTNERIETSSDEARLILRDANIIADEEIKDRFPELPSQILREEQSDRIPNREGVQFES